MIVRSPPIGLFDEIDVDEETLQLEAGDRLYFYSDGVTEAFNEQGAMFDIEGLTRLVERTQSSSLDTDLAACITELERWCNGTPLKDDVSLLAVELPGDE